MDEETQVKPLTPDDDEFTLPCGHTVRQGRTLTGCTLDACRPLDERITQEYVESHQ
jgi:hypothetical protein